MLLITESKNIKLFDDDDWDIIYANCLYTHRTFHYYNNCYQTFRMENIMKSTVGDQVFHQNWTNILLILVIPTIIKNMDYSNSSCLIFKYKNGILKIIN